ncbi:MAG: GAF domain-containing protein [Synechococcales cyanobacterium CRU_2_2]|nr:GAF domain-containing protein [Synechococcales cyanobacterium CRU_2_2]
MTQIPAQSNSAKQQSAAADLNGQPPVTLNSGSPDSGALNPSTPNPGKPVSASKIPLAPIQSMPPIPVVVNANALEMSQFDYYGTPPERRRSRMQAALNPSTGEPTASPSNSARSRFVKRWNNLGTRRKLLLLVLFSSALPTLVMTQALVSLNRGRAIADAKTAATQQAGAFRDEYVLWAEGDAASKASNLARLITATNVDVNDARSLSANASSLKNLATLDPIADPETAQSFQIVVNAQGKTIAQDLRLFATSGQIPATEEAALADSKTVQVTLPLGLDLRRFPMVQTVLSTGQASQGVESLAPDWVKTLKLNGQLQLDNQLIARDGQSLSAIAVQPIVQNNRTVGAVIVGTVFNNNHLLVDTFSLRYDISTAAVFDGTRQVATTKAGENGQLRQTEFPVAQEIQQQVLEEGEEILVLDRQAGHGYLHHYSPLYDHTQKTNPAAKPIGMTYVGQSLEPLETRFLQQQLFAYGLGGSMLLLTALLTLPAASSITEPLRKLSGFMGRVSRGDRRVRLNEMERTDEVGELTQSLNRMVTSLEGNEVRLQQELSRNRILAKIANLRSLDSHSLAEGLESALGDAREFLGCDRLVIYRCDALHELPSRTSNPSRTLYEAILPGLPSAVKLNVSDACLPERTLQTYRNGEYKSNPDVYQAGFGPEHLQLLERLKVKASLIMPIHSNRELYGLLMAHDCRGPRPWAKTEIEVMQSIADQVAVTLGYITLLEQQRASEQSIRDEREIFQHRALELLQEVDPVSQGDLTVRARVTEDEIGTIADSYNSTVESLRKIVTQVKAVSGQVTTTAEQNDAAVQKLAAEALLQTEKIEASLTQIQAMATTVRALTEQAKAAQQAVIATTRTVESAIAK